MLATFRIRDLWNLRQEQLQVWDFHDTNLSSAREWTIVILAANHDMHHHSSMCFSECVVVAETSYQVLEVLSICYQKRA